MFEGYLFRNIGACSLVGLCYLSVPASAAQTPPPLPAAAAPQIDPQQLRQELERLRQEFEAIREA